jgi:hypothetical protein
VLQDPNGFLHTCRSILRRSHLYGFFIRHCAADAAKGGLVFSPVKQQIRCARRFKTGERYVARHYLKMLKRTVADWSGDKASCPGAALAFHGAPSLGPLLALRKIFSIQHN